MEGDDAILQDAPKGEEQASSSADKAVERQKTAREIAMESIRASRNAAFEEESGVKLEPREPAKEPGTESPAAEGQEPAKEPDHLSVSSQLGKQLDDGFFELGPEDLKRIRVRTKVEGKEELVDGSKALGQYQKSAAAEIRLESATQMKREAERLLAEATTRAATATTAAEKSAATKDAATAQQELDAVQKQFLDALYGGDVEKAGELFGTTVNAAVEKALAGRAPGATPDPDQIARRAAELALPQLRQATSRESALNQLKSDYPDIFTDADYAFLTDRRINSLIAEGKSESDAIRDAGHEIAEKFGLKKVAPERTTQPADSTTRSERLAAKKAGLDEPEATAARAATGVKPPASASDIIARMRESRGQL